MISCSSSVLLGCRFSPFVGSDHVDVKWVVRRKSWVVCLSVQECRSGPHQDLIRISVALIS